MEPYSGLWDLPPLTLPIPLCFISCHSYHPSFTSSHTGLPAVPHKQEAHCCLRALELTVLSLEHSPHMLHGQGLLWGVHAKSLHPYPTVSEPMDCSLPGSSVHRTLQARILEWVAIPFSRGSSWPRDRTWVSCDSYIAGRFFTAEPAGKPGLRLYFHLCTNVTVWAGFLWSSFIKQDPRYPQT